MKVDVSKFQAAGEQLDWAVRLFLDFQAYIPAITLAGAAEEILGEPLGHESAFSVLKDKLTLEFSLPPKEISQSHLNQAKNWLKHWRGMEDPEHISLDLRNETIQQLARAFSNLLDHNIPLSEQATRFLQWAQEERAV